MEARAFPRASPVWEWEWFVVEYRGGLDDTGPEEEDTPTPVGPRNVESGGRPPSTSPGPPLFKLPYN